MRVGGSRSGTLTWTPVQLRDQDWSFAGSAPVPAPSHGHIPQVALMEVAPPRLGTPEVGGRGCRLQDCHGTSVQDQHLSCSL